MPSVVDTFVDLLVEGGVLTFDSVRLLEPLSNMSLKLVVGGLECAGELGRFTYHWILLDASTLSLCKYYYATKF